MKLYERLITSAIFSGVACFQGVLMFWLMAAITLCPLLVVIIPVWWLTGLPHEYFSSWEASRDFCVVSGWISAFVGVVTLVNAFVCLWRDRMNWLCSMCLTTDGEAL